ncbi:TPA: hypothetical protein O8297_002408 [Staphylococcus aureus]|nr:hypothetical protein [Staphylococcus aureus]
METILGLIIFGVCGFIIYNSNQKHYRRYQSKINDYIPSLKEDIQVGKINSIATDEQNRDEVVFDWGFSTSVTNKNVMFVESLEEEKIEFQIPNAKSMDKHYKKTFSFVNVTDKDFEKYLYKYVLVLGIKLYITRESYEKLKRNRIITAK